MKLFGATLLLLLTNLVYSQAEFRVDNFSLDYYSKISISDTSEVFSKGWIAIYENNKKDFAIQDGQNSDYHLKTINVKQQHIKFMSSQPNSELK